MSKSASSSILVDFRLNAKKKDVYELKIEGRGTSVLGNVQGDHVTPYGLVEYGFYRILDGLRNEEVNNLFELQNRKSLRHRRSRLYDFISAIAVLDYTKKKESLYGRIDAILADYNKKRSPKKKIRESTKVAKNDTSLIGSNLETILTGIEAKYKENGALVRDTLKEITRLVLTFYNHIPHTTYFPIDGFAASSDEGSIIKAALSEIEKNVASSKQLQKKNPVVELGKCLKSVADATSRLIHYPEITGVKVVEVGVPKVSLTFPDSADLSGVVCNRTKIISSDDVLGAHRAHTLYNGAVRTAKSRDNTQEMLIKAITRHLHIVRSVYELDEHFYTKERVLSVVEKIIKDEKVKKKCGDKEIDVQMGWPSFVNATDEIAVDVLAGLDELRKKSEIYHYTMYEEYDDLESSSDEEESTKPNPRITVPKANAQAQIEQDYSVPIVTICDELWNFFNAIVDAKVELPEALIEKIKDECPTLCSSQKLYFIRE